jgi:hypothetical protein
MSEIALDSFAIPQKGQKVVSYRAADESKFMAALEFALQSGGQFMVIISKVMSRSVLEINEVFKKHNVAVQITADSDPKAVDYFFSALGGATCGAATGFSFGAAF